MAEAASLTYNPVSSPLHAKPMLGRLGSPYVIAILLLVGTLPLVGWIALYRFSDRLLRPPRPTLTTDGAGNPHVEDDRRPAMIGIALGRATPGSDGAEGARGNDGGAGVPVDAVVGPAAREAGLLPGDLVVGAGGRPVASAADLHDIVRSKRPGDRLSLIVRRDGSETVRTDAVLTPVPLTPEDLGLESRDVEFTGGGGLTARGWFIPADPERGDPIGSAIVMHGNASNRMRALPIALPLHEAGLSLLLFDFTGRGDSDGETCTYGWREQEDARQAARLMAELVPGRPVALCGRSLGASVALLAASEPEGAPIDAVVADSPFATLTELISIQRAAMGIPRWPFEPLYFRAVRLRGGFHPEWIDVERAATRVTAPVLLLHGDRDGIVPVDHSRRIARALGGEHELEILGGLSHNGDRPPEVVDRIVRFLAERFGRPAGEAADTRREPLSAAGERADPPPPGAAS